MSDGISEGYRAQEEARNFEFFLEKIFVYLETPSRNNLKDVTVARMRFGRYYGGWVFGGWKLITQIRRLRIQNKEEWTSFLINCFDAWVSGDMIKQLKSVSPFRKDGIAVLNYQSGEMVIKGEISFVLKEGERFNKGGKTLLVVPL